MWFPKPLKRDLSTYQCKKCGLLLFSGCNIIDEWTSADHDALPKSEYWAISEGGLKHARNDKSTMTGKDSMESKTGGTDPSITSYKIEPIDWMKSQMIHEYASINSCPLLRERGKLACPGCSSKLGSWDWRHPDPYCSFFIIPSKVYRTLR